MNIRIAVAAIFIVLSMAATHASSAKKPVPNICKYWNTKTFFRFAMRRDVSRCLKKGVDVNKTDEKGFTPLHLAAALSKSVAVVEALIKEGANLEARNFVGATPLHMAAANNTPGIVAALIEAGADPNARDSLGFTPLHSAVAYSNSPAVAAELLQKGADPNARSAWGLLRRHGRMAMVPLKGYSNPNPRARSGFTPLHQAGVLGKTPAIIKLLLDAGADISIKDGSGKTAFDYARKNPAFKGTWVLGRLG